MKVNANITVHFHFHPDPGQAEILTAIREAREAIMSEVNTTSEQFGADVQELVNDVHLIMDDVPARVNAAVAKAMADAGVDETTARAAMNNADETVKTAIASIKGSLPPATSPTTGTDTTPGTDTNSDTVVSGSGSDTLGGANTLGGPIGDDALAGGGTDTSVGGQASDTSSLTGGQGEDSLGSGTGAETVSATDQGQPASGGATPPASNAV